MEELITPELRAIENTYKELKTFDNDAQVRIINWLIQKFQLQGQTPVSVESSVAHQSTIVEKPQSLPNENHASTQGTTTVDASTLKEFPTLKELFKSANPSSGPEKALLAAAFIQVKNKTEELSAQIINRELKAIKHPSGNITSDMASLIKRSPALMELSTSDSNENRSRKKYRVTDAGILRVRSLIY